MVVGDKSADEFSQLLVRNPAGRNRHVRLEGWRRRIHKVPEELRTPQNEHFFNPAMVSLGPYHHGKAELSRGERFKYICLDSCSSGDVERKALLYNLILRNIGEIRGCYAEVEIVRRFEDDDLALMMLLDGCFILNFMVNNISWPDPHANTEQVNININNNNDNNNNNIVDWIDFLGLASSIPYATRDMLLLENQVPFLVITLLMSSLYDEGTRKLLLARFFYWTISVDLPSREFKIPGAEQEAPIHLLEACWRVLVMKEDNVARDRPVLNQLTYSSTAFYKNRSVASLKANGIVFSKSDSQSLRDINFKAGFIRGHLLIPFRYISLLTPVVASNLIAYEVSPGTRTEHVVLCYINLMKSLIQTPEDVIELQRKGILLNKFANDEQVVQAFKEIDTFGLARFDTFRDVWQGIDGHCKKKRKTLLVNLYYTNFRTPWSTMGFFAAVLLLFLASVQAYFTAFLKK